MTTPNQRLTPGLSTALPVTIPADDPDAEAATAGGGLVLENGCLSCHAIGAAGAAGPGPDLTNEASKNRGKQWQIDHLKDPASQTPGSSMPAFAGFSDEEYDQIATFLEGLGTKYK